MITSEEYWRGIFERNPDFCSWQDRKQARVLEQVRARLHERPGLLSVLDFGIGSMGLYRSLEHELLQRLTVTGISESRQHDEGDPLLERYRIRVETGPGLTALEAVPDASHDHVLCTYVFAYLDDPTRAQALQAFARVLAPGGRLTLVLHHSGSERADKFRRSEPYWPAARALYERLLQGRYAEATVQLKELGEYLDSTFARELGYQGYLASYLKTAARFLATFCANGRLRCAIPEPAMVDCEQVMRAIGREQAMTCHAFRPVARPAVDLALPPGLVLRRVVECRDPQTGAPIANVLCADERPGPRIV